MHGGPECSREAFIEKNLGLARACANRFRGRGIEYDDLFQAACCGLVKACDGFDPGRGLMFSTYAVPVILGEVRRLFRDGGSVKVSRRLKEIARRAGAERDALALRSNEEPKLREIAERVGCDEQTLVEALCCARAPVSLSALAQEDESEHSIAVTDAGFDAVTDRLSLASALARLTPQERQILHERFFCNRTQAVTARRVGSTQVGVSRMEKRILRKLRGEIDGE
ncbi:MAG: sigma-70 family RNA polymerase sigma factor [Oscillospiraceae bacterium]|nr:sigma-70 family RNA polymerase sigma factor [Oscillospiraceae bacterium]